MKDSLFDLVKNYSSLSISGMCKNAGKTTALNSIINNVPENETLALTSIGRDGEEEDILTLTPKPGIFIREGSLFATSAGLLRQCDVTREVLETTGISTPLGEVVVLRALSDGFVQLAGPSVVTQLVGLNKLFRQHGAKRVIIDGALGRKSLCSRSLTEATVLCTGASFSRSMEDVVAETAHVCGLLMTEESDDAIQAIGHEKPMEKFILLGSERETFSDGVELADALKKAREPRILYVEGAVTDSMLDPLVRAKLPEALMIVARDASKLLLSSACLRRLTAQKGRLGVLEGIHLAAVTINPFSANGDHFDETVFLRRMSEAISVPVVNVVRDG